MYLFLDKMICGYCGSPVSAETCTARNGEVIRYYRFHGIKRYRTDCELKMVRKDVQEAELMVNLLIRQIVFYNDRIDIYFHTPLKNGPDADDRGRSFCIRHVEVGYATYHKGMPETVCMRIEMFV